MLGAYSPFPYSFTSSSPFLVVHLFPFDILFCTLLYINYEDHKHDSIRKIVKFGQILFLNNLFKVSLLVFSIIIEILKAMPSDKFSVLRIHIGLLFNPKTKIVHMYDTSIGSIGIEHSLYELYMIA